MSDRYPSNRNTRQGYSAQPGISRGTSRSGGTRTSSGAYRSGSGASRSSTAQRSNSRFASDTRSSSYGARSSGGQRSSASRQGYAQRPSGSGARRPQGSGQRSSYNGGSRRQPPRRRQPKGRFYALIAIAAVLVIAAVIIIPKLTAPTDNPVPPQTDTAANNTQPTTENTGTDTGSTGGEGGDQSQYESIAEMLADTDNQVDGLSEEEMVIVESLSVNQSLPTEWFNILLLGTDGRTLQESARTDAMIICSINRNTGEVKLSSIMRDLKVTFTDIGRYNGTYGINAAAFFGGPKLAIKTVNECFQMNIQYYVMVNFFGFQKVAERLGGIDVDISEQEMNLINERIWEQYKFGIWNGMDESDIQNEFVTTFGENVHLNGRATLAYARLRKTDGGDYRRTERQQLVLTKLMEKVKQLNALQITTLAAELIDQVQTNIPLDDIIQIAIQVGGNGISGLKTFRLPVNGTFKEERRNDDSGLWDCDWDTNATKLYSFIYG